MPDTLGDRLDFELAWKRVLADLREGRTFYVPPFMRQLIQVDLETWLDRIRDRVSRGVFQPSAQKICEVPKGKGAVRPGCVLALSDQILYNALVISMDVAIREALDWGEPPPDYAYRPRVGARSDEWFEPPFANWRKFDSDSLELMNQGYEFVVVADIAGYYEQIDLQMLRSDLNALSVDRDALSLLNECLHRWAPSGKRGVPQGYSPSDLLAKLYLNSVDRALSALGIRHIRWVDDYRIFCRSLEDAKRALVHLAALLRSRGLVLQSAKTEILTVTQARPRFEGVHSILDPIAERLLAEAVEALGRDFLSGPVEQIDRFLATSGASESIEVLEEAYETHIVRNPSYNKTLFRFLLNRLRSSGSTYAVEHALSQLEQRPEETTVILSYVKGVGELDRREGFLVNYFTGPSAVYDYQLYQVLRWRVEQDDPPSEQLVALAARVLMERARPAYVISAAQLLVGKWGAQGDLERLVGAYPDTDGEQQRASIICGSARMELSRRNAFLGHAQGDGELCGSAARLVREGSVRFE